MKIVRRERVDDSSLQGAVAHPVIRQILASRGLKTADDVDMSLKSLLPPYTLTDITKAAQRIAQAITLGEKVMISGDYDVDGMSGTTLGMYALQMLGLPREKITYHVPSRYIDGYGLSHLAIDEAVEQQVQLIVTVDTGITAIESVEYAREKGIEVVVTDHHEMQEELPNAIAVVDPKRKDDAFPSKNLCGCGVLFYVMAATRAELIKQGFYNSFPKPNLAQLLDLVALGTIGDMMPLDSNNRRLLRAGLCRIQEGKNCLGLQAMITTLGLKQHEMSGHSIAFDICPRINAATRIMLDYNPAMKTLLSSTEKEALRYAEELDMCNKRRIDHEKVMLSRAVELYRTEQTVRVKKDGALKDKTAEQAFVEKEKETEEFQIEQDYGIVLFDPTFLNGIVGLVANKLRERFSVPCLVFGADLGAGKDGAYNLLKDAAVKTVDGVSPASLEEVRQQRIEEFAKPDCKTVVVGSARSADGLDLMEIFAYIKEQDPSIFVTCGGHAFAAGASVHACDIPRLRQLFNEACKVLKHEAITKEKPESAIVTDGELPEDCLSLAFALELEKFAPWGLEYEEPLFDGLFFVEQCIPVGQRHVRFKLVTKDGIRCDAIRFRATKLEKAIGVGATVRMVYKVTVDRYYIERLQLIAEKIEVVEEKSESSTQERVSC